MVSRKPVKVQIVDETGERFLVRTFADGTVEREAIVKKPRKRRYLDHPYWVWKFERAALMSRLRSLEARQIDSHMRMHDRVISATMYIVTRLGTSFGGAHSTNAGANRPTRRPWERDPKPVTPRVWGFPFVRRENVPTAVRRGTLT
jgi:hypothetical protein